jgi:hypothetical protein
MCGFVIIKQQKARKEHRCAACSVPIPKGFTYCRSFDSYDGRGFTTKWHIECREAFDDMLRENGDCEGAADQVWEDDMPDHIKEKYRKAGMANGI